MTRGRWRADFVHVRANDAIWGPQAADFVQVDDNDVVRARQVDLDKLDHPEALDHPGSRRGDLDKLDHPGALDHRGRSITRGARSPGALDRPGEARCFRV